ncbi:MAG TPA: MFS transporter [Terriglobales bacterium]|nr:MFS transporter [Terriglobales bacterium]
MNARRNLVLIFISAFLRSASVGLLGVILAVYLARIGLSPSEIGFVLTAGLAGSAAATAAVSRYGEQFGRRRVLFAAAVVSACGGVALALVHSPAALIALAFACMLNGMGTDRSVAFAVEQAIIPGLVNDRTRTWALSWYNVVLDTSGALGALAGALPVALAAWQHVAIITAYRGVFVAFVALNLAAALLYVLLDANVEAAPAPQLQPGGNAITQASKRLVWRIAALFALDAAGGGLLADSLWPTGSSTALV